LAVLACDVDRFKARNDELGHQGGDDALRAIAACLEAAAGDRGSAYRVGGDEFALLVDVRGEGEARQLAERLGAAVAADVGLTMSIGVALEDPGEGDAALVARADAAAYAIKRAGRAGVALAPPPPARTLATRA
jgi:diguanylate cyclase (GGDEF)-like protein